jgi:Cd2+/Zn2+-exporting ATPase
MVTTSERLTQSQRSENRRIRFSAYLTGITFFCLIGGFLASRFSGGQAVGFVAYLLACIAGGWSASKKAWQELKRFRLDIDLLMLIAALGAIAVGKAVDGAVLLFLFSLANTLEEYALGRTRQAIRALEKLRPERALVLRGDLEVWVPVEELAPGDRIRVGPGERLPADGIIVEGESAVDESALTGESLPVDKAPGNSVFSCTLNGNGALLMEVTRPNSQSTLARLINLVERAQTEKSHAEEFTQWIKQRYTVLVLVGAAFALMTFLALGHSFGTAFHRATVLLVAASPCALVISTPAAVLSAMARGARGGVLFKSGAAIEALARVEAMALDKTGTLTQGKPRLTNLAALRCDEQELLSLAAALERPSEHPIARAIVAFAEQKGAVTTQASAVKAIPGEGIQGEIGNESYWAGNLRLARRSKAIISSDARAALARFEEQGCTTIILGNQGILGILGVADTLRPESKVAVQRLRVLGLKNIQMLTGDNARVARAISEELGLDEFHAQLLPEDKVALIRELRRRHGRLAMVGDGLNDAPVLAAADVGVAMGGAGNDVALEASDVVLMSDNLSRLPWAVGLARATRRITLQNLTIGLVAILTLVTLTLSAHLELPVAVIGHEGSTVLVVLNGLRLLFWRSSALEG